MEDFARAQQTKQITSNNSRIIRNLYLVNGLSIDVVRGKSLNNSSSPNRWCTRVKAALHGNVPCQTYVFYSCVLISNYSTSMGRFFMADPSPYDVWTFSTGIWIILKVHRHLEGWITLDDVRKTVIDSPPASDVSCSVLYFG